MLAALPLFAPQSPGLTVLALSVVAAAGLAIGSIRFKGISLGIGGVLFAGLALGYFLSHGTAAARHQPLLNEHILEFVREFGLILFVYTVGVQVGPGFLASLRKDGLRLNLMATGIVLLGAILTVGITWFGHVRISDAVGLFSGSTTNTPSLAAASQLLLDLKPEARAGTAAAYAITYPFGILGIILTMLGVRAFFKISLAAEGESLARQQAAVPSLTTINLEVRNPNLEGQPIRELPALDDQVVISRVMHDQKLEVARPDTIVHVGDVLLAVGSRHKLDKLRMAVGQESRTDLKSLPSHITQRTLLVTQSSALGQTVDELNLVERFGVTITRIRRGEIELAPSPNVRLQFGDTVTAVGDLEAINRVATELGNSLKRLNYPQIIPVFVGLALGVIVGSIPISLPGLSSPVKLGLAGGPLVVAIILSRLGHFGPLVWYLPQSANFALREIGIVLFLSCVGFMSADVFFDKIRHIEGLYWLGYGAMITLVPLLVMALVARLFWRMNFMTICGLLAGSMTDPPALQFAGTVTESDAPSIAYVTVYPLTMLLRIVAAQVLVLGFM